MESPPPHPLNLRRVFFFEASWNSSFTAVVPGLVVKAALANIANQEGNISMSYQSKEQQVNYGFFFVLQNEKQAVLTEARTFHCQHSRFGT